MSKILKVILAASPEGGIGFQNTIPWALKGDLKRFKELTMGNIVIMGKNTYNSLPSPLRGRIMIVVSATLAETKDVGNSDGVDYPYFVETFDDALELASNFSEDTFVIGGASLYNECFKMPCEVYLTLVHKKPKEGYDTYVNLDLKGYNLLGTPQCVYEQDPETGVWVVSHVYTNYRHQSLIGGTFNKDD